MRRMQWMLGLVVFGLLSGGCLDNDLFTKNFFYKRPNIEGWYAQVNEGWTKGQVITLLGKPTNIVEHELFYIYDDPERPVRLRFVLDEKDLVTQKYYETKDELEKKMLDATAKPAVPKEKSEAYPGAPLDRFTAPPGQPVF